MNVIHNSISTLQCFVSQMANLPSNLARIADGKFHNLSTFPPQQMSARNSQSARILNEPYSSSSSKCTKKLFDLLKFYHILY